MYSHIDTYRIIQMSKQAITKTGPENNREKPATQPGRNGDEFHRPLISSKSSAIPSTHQ